MSIDAACAVSTAAPSANTSGTGTAAVIAAWARCRVPSNCATPRARRLEATRQQVITGRSRRERLYHSAYARLEARLETLPVIEQAKGILMAQTGCAPEQAFDMLRRISQRSNIKVRDLADDIVSRAAAGAPKQSA